MNLGALAPDAYRAMAKLDAFVAAGPLPRQLLELVRLRASQLNGCAYCVDMHSGDAHRAGVDFAKLNAVVVWRDVPAFDEQERAALALTEAATRLDGGVPDAVWDEAARVFTPEQLAALVVAIATINAWNRMGVTVQMTPESFAS